MERPRWKSSKIKLNLRLSQDSPRSPTLQPSGHTPVASIHEPFIQLSGLQPHTQLPLPG